MRLQGTSGPCGRLTAAVLVVLAIVLVVAFLFFFTPDPVGGRHTQGQESVIGKPILSLADGARLHEVKDVILGAGNDDVVGLLADEGGGLPRLARRTHRGSRQLRSRRGGRRPRREGVIAANEVPEIESPVERDRCAARDTRVRRDRRRRDQDQRRLLRRARPGEILGFELSGGVLHGCGPGDALRSRRVAGESQSRCRLRPSRDGGPARAAAGWDERCARRCRATRPRARSAKPPTAPRPPPARPSPRTPSSENVAGREHRGRRRRGRRPGSPPRHERRHRTCSRSQ